MKTEKYLIFDSGSLINFSTNSLLNVMRKLKRIFKGEFLITHEIKHEVIDYPLKVRRFEWGALRINRLLEEGVLKLAEEIIDINLIKKEADKILNIANDTFIADHKSLHILDKGEAEVLAVSKILTERKRENLIIIDERTTRVLCERPENLQKLLQKKLHTNIRAEKANFKFFKNFKVIRSTELGYIAYKKGFLQVHEKKALEAVTYGLKYGGCSISEKEVLMYKDMR